jgi:hypothetical protein
MRKRLFLIATLILLLSCAGVIKNASIEKPYRNKSFAAQRLVVLPFSRHTIEISNKEDSVSFDSLNVIAHGMLVNALYTVLSGSVAATVNNVIPKMIDDPEAQSNILQLLEDSATMMPHISIHKYNNEEGTTITKYDTVIAPDMVKIKPLISDAQKALYIDKITTKRTNGARKIALEFIFLDMDSNGIIMRGSTSPTMTFTESRTNYHPTGATWLKWFSEMGKKAVEKSPFLSDFGNRTLLSFTFKEKKKGVKVYAGSYWPFNADKALKTRSYKTLRKVSDPINELLRKMSKDIKQVIEDSLRLVPTDSNMYITGMTYADIKLKNAAKSRYQLELLKASSPMNGLVLLETTVDKRGGMKFRRFYNSIQHPGILNIVYSTLNANDSVVQPEPLPEKGIRFMLPLSLLIVPRTFEKGVLDHLDSMYIVAFDNLQNLQSGDVAANVQLQQAHADQMRYQQSLIMNQMQMQMNMQMRQQQNMMMQMQLQKMK